MAKNSFTFDTDSGTPYGINLTINTGVDFVNKFTATTTSGSAFNFTNWTGSSQIAKSVSIGSTSYAAATFADGFSTDVTGQFQISLGSTQTRSLKEGRYVYDILVSSGLTAYRIIEGNILVRPGISSAP